jgi:hypothetical protein
MHRKNVLWTLAASLALITTARADVVGDIQVVYSAPNPFGLSPFLDGPVFVIENMSDMNITNGVLTIGGSAPADSFQVGTVPAGWFVWVIPGITDDRQPGHTFFRARDSILDTSDAGPAGDDVAFQFTGLWGDATVDSGIFTPAATRGPSNDGTIPDLNFLGGPGDHDGPCNNCFGPQVVATLQTGGGGGAGTANPEPSTWLLMIVGLAGLLGYGWRRKQTA